MTTQANAIEQTSFVSTVQAPSIPVLRRFFWSLRRELWENRSLYIAPLAVGALIVIAFFIAAVRVPDLTTALGVDPQHRYDLLFAPFRMAAMLIMATAFIVAIFYCLDALHGERRDRSILFWKSLPVSDLMTVLSKMSVPLIVLPIITFAVTIATQCVMLVLGSAVLAARGAGAAPLWNVPLLPLAGILLYHLITIHALWYAPIYAWLLLVSASVRRAPLLWAVLPLLAITVLERVALGTRYFGHMLADRFAGGPDGSELAHGDLLNHPLQSLTPGHFFASPGLWIGLLVAAIFLAAAVRLRRSRGVL